MRFFVDELPWFSDDCPFVEREWHHNVWTSNCKLTGEKCNLHKTEGECNGLIKAEWGNE